MQKFFHWSLLTRRHYELFWRNIDHHLKPRNHWSLGNTDKRSKRGIEQTSNEWMKPKLKKYWVSINLNQYILYRPWLLSFGPCTESAFPDHTWPIIAIIMIIIITIFKIITIIMIIIITVFKILMIIMIIIAPWKPEVDFAACDSSPILMFYPLVPRTQDLWILSSFLPALIISWSTIWANIMIKDCHLKEPQCDRMIWWSRMIDLLWSQRATCCVPFHQDTSGTGLPPLASHLF